MPATGPSSPEAKRRVSRNAVRTGKYITKPHVVTSPELCAVLFVRAIGAILDAEAKDLLAIRHRPFADLHADAAKWCRRLAELAPDHPLVERFGGRL